ncbi:sodium channel protein Nach-like [Schistocerca piceifrons]|uniref:sodium channel protein Nach-like n=1 Tax=Schistocerca piceifrons TaxID=274613 RepID=UPI001F5FEE06|nr:sodium channel protein Nach-like [Schistocerca piceifrons]
MFSPLKSLLEDSPVNSSSSLTGMLVFGYVLQVDLLLWAVVQVAAGVWCARYILAVYRDYQDTPTATTVESTTHPIWSVPFPALAVCNNNRISRAAVIAMAANMSAATGLEAGRLERLLPLLGRLHETQPGDPRHPDPRLRELHGALELAAQRDTPAAGEAPYHVTRLMRQLTPKCEQMMVRCSWLGHTRPCGELFKLRKTCDGYCCIFNYRRTGDHFGKGSARIRKVLRVNATGPYMGLTVLVDTMTHDYVYPLIATRGLKVVGAGRQLLLFKPGDFADASSGGLVEKLLGPRREFFIRLSAQTVAATSEVRSFSPQKRRCLFEDELQERLGMDYSQSDCLVSCRIRSITTLCRCRPFYLPDTEKWATPRPPDGIPGLELEREESIDCPECLPSCSDVHYTIRANSAPFAPPNGLDTSHPLLDGVELGNHSIVNLYFERADSVLLRQDVLYYWYDLLSK